MITPPGKEFSQSQAYTLRPGYEWKPEIMECKVNGGSYTWVHENRTETTNRMSNAIDDPRFFGFKYEDKTINDKIWSVPRIYRVGEGEYSVCGNSDCKVLTPTHVLFRIKP